MESILKLLPSGSVANKPEAIRMLFTLAEELAVEPEKQKKSKLTPEERQQKNIAEGRPAKSHFPWTEEERHRLEESYNQNAAIEAPGTQFERSPRAVAIQLEKMGLITAEELMAYT
ncbi:hypothetical protein MUA02_02890 [Enterobacteriaceae bacterium H20N1]|uniref:Uncharacterized protein n=1 Tax=Dryocola boscaweniae TaxID=2925397 RepID=A0A9X2W4W5_9ENTR|nr:hypothetical protein [Dryocola boscaweniae]MCT4700795.1 hypothetical protein [Dryocola boscaweniae]MCT4718000.1 hypothetical protein [Dryocola boscaweniae]